MPYMPYGEKGLKEENNQNENDINRTIESLFNNNSNNEEQIQIGTEKKKTSKKKKGAYTHVTKLVDYNRNLGIYFTKFLLNTKANGIN